MMMGCTGMYWAVLGCIGLNWAVLVCSGLGRWSNGPGGQDDQLR